MDCLAIDSFTVQVDEANAALHHQGDLLSRALIERKWREIGINDYTHLDGNRVVYESIMKEIKQIYILSIVNIMCQERDKKCREHRNKFTNTNRCTQMHA